MKQEGKSVTVLALGLGLVGVDRYLISTMYPLIARDLHLGYGDIGTITGALAITWGVAALLMGNLSDYIGRRRVLVAALLVFALLIGASGFATGLFGLVLVRLMMGFADGAYTPASISATIEASPPKRHGRNIGIQQMTLPLFGLGLSPLAVGLLLHVVNWRWVFSIFMVPGFFLAWLTWRVIPDGSAHGDSSAQNSFSLKNSISDWLSVLSYSNIRVLSVLMLCWLTCLVTTSAFIPSFLMEHLHLGFGSMGTIMSSIGFGAAAGTLTLPWLSDRIGRKAVMLLATVGACAMLLLLNVLGPNVPLLFLVLFMVHYFNNALITLTVGPFCSETVPPALMATASGVVIAVGELLGGGIAPMLAGQVALHFGIARVLWLPIATLAVAFVLCLYLRETLPVQERLDAEPSAA